MRGDFSRIRFIPYNGYTDVLKLQGRVELDSDANEQSFIDDHLRGTETVDVVGRYGGPADDAGFAISVEDGEILIGPGRYYVDGLLCENPSSLSYDSQPHLLNAAASGSDLLTELATTEGLPVIQIYLEVWQRFVTALDDPCLRESALGRADTTARLQTVWRVVGSLQTNVETSSTGEPPGLSPCCRAMYALAGQPSAGRMAAQTNDAGADCGCQPIPAAGYQGVENQLYRIEIHTGGDHTTATFKWSRENGSVVSAVTSMSGPNLNVNSLGPDTNLGFAPQQWVELTDDNYLFGGTPNQPGELYQVQSLQSTGPSMTLTGSVTPLDPSHNARVRRWDQSGPAASTSGIPLSAGTWIPLENGIEVCFEQGTYQSGDYWTIPARAATGTIEWPPCGSDGNPKQPPRSTHVKRAPLACIHIMRLPEPRLIIGLGHGPRVRYPIDDCRLTFEPLTAKPQAIYIDTVSWDNDTVMTFDQLVANGLIVALSQAPTSPIGGANFIVTIEALVLPQVQDDDVVSRFVATEVASELPSTLLRSITIVDTEIEVNGQSVSWVLPYANANGIQRAFVEGINQLLLLGASSELYARLRVKLLGDTIFATGDTGSIYLDGRAFGGLVPQADGTQRINLQLPSGNSAVASDFESWLSLAPILAARSVTPEYPQLTVSSNPGGVVTVQADVNGTMQDVSQTATVALNYPALGPAQLSVSLEGNPSTGAVATVPATVAIETGDESVVVPVSIVANPGATQLTLTIEAQVTALGGPQPSIGGSFTLTGTAAETRPLPGRPNAVS